MTTKIHAVVDALGNPAGIMLSPGQDHDLTCAEALTLLWQIFERLGGIGIERSRYRGGGGSARMIGGME